MELTREQIERVLYLSQNSNGAITAIDGVPVVGLCRMALRAQRYQSMLSGYARALDKLARVHDALRYNLEAADYRGRVHEIETEMDGGDNG